MRPTSQNNQTRVGLQTTSNTGICAGTLIMTTDGEIPVEHLVMGDRIVTRDGAVPLRAIASRDVVICPVRVKASSLGHSRPDRDVLVTLQTLIHVDDWRAEVIFGVAYANVAAGRLIDGEYLSVLPAQQMKVFDLGMDEDQIIYADRIEVLTQAA